MYFLLTIVVTFCAETAIAGQGKPIARTGFQLDLLQDDVSSEESSSEEGPPPAMAVILVNNNAGTEDDSTPIYQWERQRTNNFNNNEYDNDVMQTDSELTNPTDSPKVILRKLWKGCNKKAANVCRKVCESVAKYTCRTHKCKGKLKGAFEKECKRECKHRYIKD